VGSIQQLEERLGKQLDGISQELRSLKLSPRSEEELVEIQQSRLANSQLEADNQQLLERHNQLEAHNQQLRFANGQLEADNRRLRFANSQLEADNQQRLKQHSQLGADNQQIRFANRQLEADNQQRLKQHNQLEAKRPKETNQFQNIPHYSQTGPFPNPYGSGFAIPFPHNCPLDVRLSYVQTVSGVADDIQCSGME
jgi:hypothetical protein